MPRVPINWVDTAGGSPGQMPQINDAGTEMEYVDPPTGGGITGLTSADSSVTITDNGDGTLNLAASSGGGGGGADPDPPPGTPSAYDDEFDGTSSVTWTALPQAPTSWDVATRPGYLLFGAGTTAAMYGKTQAVPGSYPYTITVKRSATTGTDTSGPHFGIVLAPAAPTASSPYLWCGNIQGTGIVRASGSQLVGGSWTSSTTGLAAAAFPYVIPTYLRFKVNSASSVDVQVSADGQAWMTVNSALNPGFTPGVMGIGAIGGGSNSVGHYAFFRIT